METVGVLCARMRVEERMCLAALESAGLQASLVHAGIDPMPPFPSSTSPSADIADGNMPQIIIDRFQQREIAAPIMSLHHAAGHLVIDAGIASVGSRLDIALALSKAGVARPLTALAASEMTALQQLERVGYPATLLPMALDSPAVPVYDRDSAESVFEHRSMLGCAAEQTALLQSGTVDIDELPEIVVVDGTAVGVASAQGQTPAALELLLAESAAIALGARLIAVQVAQLGGNSVVWDVTATPEFRHAEPLGERDVATAIADLAVKLLQSDEVSPRARPSLRLASREVFSGFILSA